MTEETKKSEFIRKKVMVAKSKISGTVLPKPPEEDKANWIALTAYLKSERKPETGDIVRICDCAWPGYLNYEYLYEEDDNWKTESTPTGKPFRFGDDESGNVL